MRGLGIFAGIEFVKDKETKEPLPVNARFNGRVFNSCMGRGLLIYPGSGSLDGSRGDHIQVGPPLVVKKSEIDEIVRLLDEGIGEAEKQVL